MQASESIGVPQITASPCRLVGAAPAPQIEY